MCLCAEHDPPPFHSTEHSFHFSVCSVMPGCCVCNMSLRQRIVSFYVLWFSKASWQWFIHYARISLDIINHVSHTGYRAYTKLVCYFYPLIRVIGCTYTAYYVLINCLSFVTQKIRSCDKDWHTGLIFRKPQVWSKLKQLLVKLENYSISLIITTKKRTQKMGED